MSPGEQGLRASLEQLAADDPPGRFRASVKLMHYQGDLLGEGPIWGYVKGGMGMVSFAIADAAREAGAVLAAGVPVGEILPGEGVRLDDLIFIGARTVVSNADPKRVLDMVPDDDMPGVYLCSAATHPGGSVIATNGRNAAAAVLADLNR